MTDYNGRPILVTGASGGNLVRENDSSCTRVESFSLTSGQPAVGSACAANRLRVEIQ